MGEGLGRAGAAMATGDWKTRLALVDELMKSVSSETDPQSLVRAYTRGVKGLFHTDQIVSLSRRDVAAPWYRITRSRRFTREIDPWDQKDELPLLSGGVLGEWLYNEKPLFVEHFEPDELDPAYFHLKDMHAAFVMPQYEQGRALNMTVLLWEDASRVDVDDLPNTMWQGNLFGRTTHTLVLKKQLAGAYEELDRELRVVGAMQRALLPQELPEIPGVELAAEYRTSERAGGDLYDLFPMVDGSWGLFIGDVSGHGTPAAVIMAITHALAHAHPGPPEPPERLMTYLNERLSIHYTSRTPAFVTAFYGVYSPKTGILKYANAGHPPPRVVRGGKPMPLDAVRGLPLGVDEREVYPAGEIQLERGDLLMLYTDGISEAFNPAHQLFGFSRLDEALSRGAESARGGIDSLLAAVEEWAQGRPAADDQTMLAMRVK
jgi:sigma-B regulation protein RsbU (phosphoserine phosphatase)